MKLVTLDIALDVMGPVLTQSTAAARFGIDAAVARTNDNRLCLPGTLIKGRLRQSLEEISQIREEIPGDAYPLREWFGAESGSQENKGDTVEPLRGLIRFTDFTADEPEKTGRGTLQRVKMNERTGTVDKGSYLVIEAPVAPGQVVRFSGQISFLSPEHRVDSIADALETGLKWISSIGGERTVGFGRLMDVSVQRRVISMEDRHRSISVDSSTITLSLDMTPHGPFCLGHRKVSGNLFDSQEIIPGSVIKGAIASTWGGILAKGNSPIIQPGFDLSREELCRNFSFIRITHAFPSANGTRPQTPPLSLVKSGGKLADIASYKGPVLIDNDAPAFDVDWKDFSDVQEAFHWPNVGRKMLIRTAMDRQTRSAEKEKLFAYESVIPGALTWKAAIDLSRVPEQDRLQVIRQLEEITAFGLIGWGKTKTSAGISLSCVSPPPPVSRPDGNWYVTLQTPSILCDPEKLSEASDREQLLSAYRDVWEQLSEGALTLGHYYARQELLGGYYLHSRFQKANPYYPWLLTVSGSVFALKSVSGREDDARKLLTHWSLTGLPLPEWARNRYRHNGVVGDDWRTCPYIPENGFGEILVNMACHVEKRPDGTVLEVNGDN